MNSSSSLLSLFIHLHPNTTNDTVRARISFSCLAHLMCFLNDAAIVAAIELHDAFSEINSMPTSMLSRLNKSLTHFYPRISPMSAMTSLYSDDTHLTFRYDIRHEAKCEMSIMSDETVTFCLWGRLMLRMKTPREMKEDIYIQSVGWNWSEIKDARSNSRTFASILNCDLPEISAWRWHFFLNNAVRSHR